MTLVLSDKITAAVRDENIKELEKLTSEQLCYPAHSLS